MNREWTTTGPGRLALLATGLLAVAVALLIVPIRTDVTPRLPVVTDGGSAEAPPTPVPDSVDVWGADLVATNLFSSIRRAPTDHFRMPGLATEPGLMDRPADSSTMGLPLALETVEPVLLGVVRVNGPRQALIGFSSPDSTSRLVGIGGRVGGYRVRAIGADHVELRSSAGSRTLRLPRPSPSDSSELLP